MDLRVPSGLEYYSTKMIDSIDGIFTRPSTCISIYLTLRFPLSANSAKSAYPCMRRDTFDHLDVTHSPCQQSSPNHLLLKVRVKAPFLSIYPFHI